MSDRADEASVKESERSQKLEELVDLAALLNRQNEIPEAIRLIADKAASFFQAEKSFLLLVNPRTRETVRTVNRLAGRSADAALHEVQTYTSGWIIRYQQNLLSEDLSQDDRFKAVVFKNKGYRSAMGIPIWNGPAVIGALVLINQYAGGSFTSADLDYCVKFGEIISPFFRQTEQFQMFFSQPVAESQLLEKYAQLGMLGKSGRFIELIKTVESVARCDVRVMLQGASGSGKELIARAIHRNSERWGGPFVAIDCGAIPANLVESELMGHVRGAFTGAQQDRRGLFEEAHQGTLFMDEVINLPLEVQAKLLRVLQEGEVRPVGSNKSRKVDVRIITAASIPLEKRVEAGQFREDLYYRLFVFPIMVPSLNERSEDIGLLAGHFLEKFAGRQKKKLASFHPAVLDLIKRRSWPGNIRELENVIERLVTVVPPEIRVLTREMLPPEMRVEFKTWKSNEDWSVEKSLTDQVADYEAELIRRALQENSGSQTKAARALKIAVQTLNYKIKKLKIQTG
jgi:transcriptional regulator with GAF, ATPase, and Fis domain